ncbi:HAMP domain-containing histidine kinase [Massilia sp. P8910]|uniref:sensor histidine kinase n=1 Tax=Massilia antarctica TaxID=2765360 RepID=UPI0006BB5D0C|nr:MULTISPECIES: HAMP domain-containing sensor histidine kinase [Massilia]MCE3602175.1 HAMP domain-containing histidine kinase [Massilia antarctica]MCY0915961.1 HAMP domain-containing sensor histidine kinase [Massilia sp. H27-R4]CUI07250.1 sensor histidine kinase [Janthinobacterium sp. CG23_2]CUU31036.1 sensor histidine kinase [Janthinobacterium sp. CG23_2]
MKPRNSLRRRIAVAYLLFALGSSLFFAAIAIVAVEGIELHLVDHRLAEAAAWAVPRHAGGLPVGMPAGLSFHHGAAIPEPLRNLPEGVSDVHVDGIGLHVLSGMDASGNYVVVDHESDYDKVELAVYSMFGVGFIGIMLFSLFLGGFIGHRFVTPITTLAAAVRDNSSELPLLERNDELGILARAFAVHTSELRIYLERERLFTGDVSHELRTPLTVMTGAAEIILAQHDANPATGAAAERILRAANEASACVNVLLTLARSRDRIAHPVTSIEQIARAETERSQPLVAGRPVALRFLGGPAFAIAAPPELLVAAVGNLIRNACQYTVQGEVTVLLAEGLVRVEDTGPGLPLAVRATFERGPNAVPGTGSAGSGLGLALVRRICEYLGATLTFSERDGGGSIFEIRFNQALTKN